MRVAAVQCTASPDRERNLSVAGRLVAVSADDGARLVVLPELFSCYGNPAALRAAAEPLDGPVGTWAAQTAARHRIWLVAGSFVEAAADGRRYNTSILVSPEGVRTAAYRKLHLFDVDVDGVSACESAAVSAGDDVVLAEVTDGAEAVAVGLTICYDLRFPELYRALTDRGAQMVVVPSAFAAATGAAHWDLLVRARAVENQVFVVAADQVGELPGGFCAFGHSMVVDPWGRVLGERGGGAGTVVADLDPAVQHDVRSRLPSLAHRRPDAYGQRPHNG